MLPTVRPLTRWRNPFRPDWKSITPSCGRTGSGFWWIARTTPPGAWRVWSPGSGAVIHALHGEQQHQRKTDEYLTRGLPKDLKHFLRGEFDLETRLDKRIMQVLATPRVLAYLSNFLSSDGYCIHYPPMIRFKMAGAEASKLPPHQDWPYNTHMKDFLTVWVPLVVVDEGTGGVVVYEGSHQDGNVQHVAEGSWEAKALADLDKYSQLHVHMNPGDILTFPSELLHASAPQTSSRIRYSIDFRVFRAPEDSTKSFFKAKTQEIVRVD